ncbi:MAG: hypothetical protein LBS74_06455 [Oscillospiraceae bacterium]|nr:hypothetical protein [Oscillospiraceae bacterium]
MLEQLHKNKASKAGAWIIFASFLIMAAYSSLNLWGAKIAEITGKDSGLWIIAVLFLLFFLALAAVIASIVAYFMLATSKSRTVKSFSIGFAVVGILTAIWPLVCLVAAFATELSDNYEAQENLMYSLFYAIPALKVISLLGLLSFGVALFKKAGIVGEIIISALWAAIAVQLATTAVSVLATIETCMDFEDGPAALIALSPMMTKMDYGYELQGYMKVILDINIWASIAVFIFGSVLFALIAAAKSERPEIYVTEAAEYPALPAPETEYVVNDALYSGAENLQ